MTIQTTKRCPDCAETVLQDARVCKHCGYRFDGATPASASGPAPTSPSVDPAIASLPQPRGPAPLAAPAVPVDRPATNGAGNPQQQQYVLTGATGNGMAIAALVLGIVGIIVGAIPILYVGAFILGALGLVFGLIARGRAKRHPAAGRKGMATWGAALSVVAIILGVVGVVIVNNAVHQLDRNLNGIQHQSDRYSRCLARATGDGSRCDRFLGP